MIDCFSFAFSFGLSFLLFVSPSILLMGLSPLLATLFLCAVGLDEIFATGWAGELIVLVCA